MAYENTEVSIEKSQGEIRKLLRGHGADRFTFGESTDANGVRWAGVEFVHADHQVRIVAPHKPADPAWVERRASRARTRTRDDIVNEYHDQEGRRIWRVLYWTLKSRMVAIDEGVESFEQAFLAHLVNPATDRTLWDHLGPAVADGALHVNGPGLPQLPAASAAG